MIDTPGQIEVFTWSASGTIITEALVSIVGLVTGSNWRARLVKHLFIAWDLVWEGVWQLCIPCLRRFSLGKEGGIRVWE